MKMSSMLKSAALLVIVSVAATTAFAGPQKQEQVPPKGERYAYVWVTGSRIPQRVKISPIGTPTFNALSIWDRRQINQTGRGTAEDVLRQDPSVSIRLGHPGGF
jgi:outer membrane cobalamin receptor